MQRNGMKLLRTVNGKPHATDSHHHEALPTPPRSASTRSSSTSNVEHQLGAEEDINREPESTDDEKPSQPAFKDSVHQVDGADDKIPAKATFKRPAHVSPTSTGSKRSHDSDQLSSESDEIFGSQQSRAKKQKTKGFRNIHANEVKKGYSASQRRQSEKQKESERLKGLKAKETEPAALVPKFRKPASYPKDDAGEKEMKPVFKDARMREEGDSQDANSANSLSPSLSSLSDPPSSPEVEELQHLDLPIPQIYVSKTECAFCGRDVTLLLKERFEDEHLRGNEMTYKWQDRFCLYHRRHDARQIYAEGGYPDVEWSELESRMKNFHGYLRDVLRNSIPSHHRSLLSEKLKSRAKSAMQSLNSDETKKGASVGYYGPRGEKLITDHIVTHLSEDLREQSVKDKIVAASGVSGGISGFVHGVLVPELAEQLVKEDMDVSGDRARGIIAESIELGELLHPDVDDAMTVDIVER